MIFIWCATLPRSAAFHDDVKIVSKTGAKFLWELRKTPVGRFFRELRKIGDPSEQSSGKAVACLADSHQLVFILRFGHVMADVCAVRRLPRWVLNSQNDSSVLLTSFFLSARFTCWSFSLAAGGCSRCESIAICMRALFYIYAWGCLASNIVCFF